jgi:hypothetical protein
LQADKIKFHIPEFLRSHFNNPVTLGETENRFGLRSKAPMADPKSCLQSCLRLVQALSPQ